MERKRVPALSALSFDLAVLDHDMPGARGDELARETGGSPPVIGLSSAGATDAEWAGAGIAGWLQKPVDAGGLAAAVQKAMAADKSEDRKVIRWIVPTWRPIRPVIRAWKANWPSFSGHPVNVISSEMSDATEDRVWKNAAMA